MPGPSEAFPSEHINNLIIKEKIIKDLTDPVDLDRFTESPFPPICMNIRGRISGGGESERFLGVDDRRRSS